MEVLLNIPSDLCEYLEYIPQYALPSVLIHALRKSICLQDSVISNSEKKRESSSNDKLLTELLERLSSLNGVLVQPTTSEQTGSITTPEISTVEESTMETVKIDWGESNNTDDLDDLDDFMDLLK